MQTELKIINDRGKAVMSTSYIECFPSISQIASMVQNGYKFRLNGKIISKKALEEFIRENGAIKQ
jgi:hypothetical protein